MPANDDEPMLPTDRLNIDYDSDDSSMQVDSDSPINNISVHPSEQDADADAEGESIHVSSPGDRADSVAGPSSYPQRDSVRVFLTAFYESW